MSTTHTLSATELVERLERRQVRVVDVRTPAEFETAHIPGAHNVPLDALQERREQVGDLLDDDVVLVCRSGQRATQAQAVLREVGAHGPAVLEGGVTAFEQAGGDVARGRQRWDMERQVRLVAGSLVLGSVLVSTVVPAARVVAGVVGGGLTFAALTDSCMMGSLLSRLPYNRSRAHDVHAVLDRLAVGRGEV